MKRRFLILTKAVAEKEECAEFERRTRSIMLDADSESVLAVKYGFPTPKEIADEAKIRRATHLVFDTTVGHATTAIKQLKRMHPGKFTFIARMAGVEGVTTITGEWREVFKKGSAVAVKKEEMVAEALVEA